MSKNETDSAELKVGSVRWSDDTKKRFKSIIDEAGFKNQDEALNALMSMFDLDTAQELTASDRDLISEFRGHMDRTVHIFAEMIKTNHHRDELSKKKFEEQLETSSDTIQRLRDEKTNLIKANEDYVKENKHLSSELENVELIKALNDQYKDKIEDLEKLTADAARSIERSAELEKLNAELTKQLENVRKLTESQAEDLATSRKVIDKHIEAYNQSGTEIKALEKANLELQGDYQKLSNEKALSDQRLQLFENQIENERVQHDKAIENFEKRIAQFQQDYNAALAAKAAADTIKTSLESEISDLKKEVHELQDSYVEVDYKNGELVEAADKLEARMKEIIAENKKLVSENKKLKKQAE